MKSATNPTIEGDTSCTSKWRVNTCIKGSPFEVTVKLPVQQLGTPARNFNGVNGPWGVAVNQKGEIVVAQYGGHRVSIFTPSGEKIRLFGSYGSGHGQLKSPEGVAVDDDGNILQLNYYTINCHYEITILYK